MLSIIAIIFLWCVLSYVTYKVFLVNSAHPNWEKVMLSFSWPCVWVMKIIHKLSNNKNNK
jgi:hypothetical protein